MTRHAVRFRNREDRRAAERALANHAVTRYRWRDTVGRCEHCKDGVVGPVKIGSRWEPRIDSFGRPMQSGRIYFTPRLCTAHAFLTEAA